VVGSSSLAISGGGVLSAASWKEIPRGRDALELMASLEPFRTTEFWRSGEG
jgi:hypothetical protein